MPASRGHATAGGDGGQIQKDRETFVAERREYVERLMSFNRQVGELETQLRQLGAGSPEATGDDTPTAP